jgi:hypothetical protein
MSISRTIERHTAHKRAVTQATIYYHFHPLRTQCFPVIRAYTSQEEAQYVVRLPDGKPLAVPVWMTCPDAAHAVIVSVAHLPAGVLFELRRTAGGFAVLTCAQCAQGESKCDGSE